MIGLSSPNSDVFPNTYSAGLAISPDGQMAGIFNHILSEVINPVRSDVQLLKYR